MKRWAKPYKRAVREPDEKSRRLRALLAAEGVSRREQALYCRFLQQGKSDCSVRLDAVE